MGRVGRGRKGGRVVKKYFLCPFSFDFYSLDHRIEKHVPFETFFTNNMVSIKSGEMLIDSNSCS